ncbi:hypothetical protein M951_chr3177 (nucleomorph) [Lotharella oceanica]|uniref:Uncharacterized protein n=1 Tax=Lotharella oceanica TaxID=641309 RepID=A0A060DHE6_9EUKA|nr:hypothetical protein M951_chr128 [Lotharella oceanica]AIB09682.1 hypothetical protein M951_chr1203 [Lotharella oceanica]AIB09731.1 hypothetical protein M951_chr228 [Lotharella oceanica]AIB09885.1 hypothetical protein M951_chr2193 [Lotharella oceanica]AIB09934.1 hypothetical protein M951_chr328 [Lotharella oceanica]
MYLPRWFVVIFVFTLLLRDPETLPRMFFTWARALRSSVSKGLSFPAMKDVSLLIPTAFRWIVILFFAGLYTRVYDYMQELNLIEFLSKQSKLAGRRTGKTISVPFVVATRAWFIAMEKIIIMPVLQVVKRMSEYIQKTLDSSGVRNFNFKKMSESAKKALSTLEDRQKSILRKASKSLAVFSESGKKFHEDLVKAEKFVTEAVPSLAKKQKKAMRI